MQEIKSVVLNYIRQGKLSKENGQKALKIFILAKRQGKDVTLEQIIKSKNLFNDSTENSNTALEDNSDHSKDTNNNIAVRSSRSGDNKTPKKKTRMIGQPFLTEAQRKTALQKQKKRGDGKGTLISFLSLFLVLGGVVLWYIGNSDTTPGDGDALAAIDNKEVKKNNTSAILQAGWTYQKVARTFAEAFSRNPNKKNVDIITQITHKDDVTFIQEEVVKVITAIENEKIGKDIVNNFENCHSAADVSQLSSQKFFSNLGSLFEKISKTSPLRDINISIVKDSVKENGSEISLKMAIVEKRGSDEMGKEEEMLLEKTNDIWYVRLTDQDKTDLKMSLNFLQSILVNLEGKGLEAFLQPVHAELN